uniref:Uncharacterized protein n=1 Tax=Onchocerca volvulus TaxID=6282 RepID=A0A8R1TJZ6_ONCVO
MTIVMLLLKASKMQLTQSPKSNYIQNGKVHFKRSGHLNEELEFRRNPVPPQLPILLSKKELLARLSKGIEHREQIPDNAAEIFDIPEHEYKDYKDAILTIFDFGSHFSSYTLYKVAMEKQ